MRTRGIDVHPGKHSGAICIGGTRVPLYAFIESVWRATDEYGIDDIADDYNISREDVLTGCWFAGTYGVTDATPKQVHGRHWRKRWGAWAEEMHGHMWSGNWDLVTGPPTRAEADS